MNATRFDETKHRRHKPGSQQGGRFAPKPAPQAAHVAAPQTWHLLLWCDRQNLTYNPHQGRGTAANNTGSVALGRWTAAELSARDAVRGGLREAARKMGMDGKSLAELDSGWMDGLIADIPGGGACAPLPLIAYGTTPGMRESPEPTMTYLQAGSQPPAPDAEKSNPPHYCTMPNEQSDEAEKLAPGHGRDLSIAIEALSQSTFSSTARTLSPHEAYPQNPGLFVEVLAHEFCEDRLRATLLSANESSDLDQANSDLLMSGIYARLLDRLPYRLFGYHHVIHIMDDLEGQRDDYGMYRPHKFRMRLDKMKKATCVGVTLLRAAAAPSPGIKHPEAVRRKAEALAAAARRSEKGAVVGFTTGIFDFDSEETATALEMLNNDPSNRWCPPNDFRRKIFTLHACFAQNQALEGHSSRRRASEKLDAALSVVVGEPGQPVTYTEAECVRTLLIGRGEFIEDGCLTDSAPVYQSAAPRLYSTFSRQSQMACAHHANPELAIPSASKKLAARMGDYARWIMAHNTKGNVHRYLRRGRLLVQALLTSPDIPPAQVAGLYVMQEKLIPPSWER